ncbi:MAG: hypothetical protein AABW58_00650 [Nanoarchaeota archaeon]
MIKGKRGAVESETIHVTGLVILIGILIILYMFLIPPEAKEDILEGRGVGDDYDGFTSGKAKERKDGETFLLETPGFLFPQTKDKEEIKISPVNLFSKSSQKIINLASSVSVSRSLITNNYQDLSFTLTNPENTNKLRVFFNAVETKGPLQVYINSKLAFKGTPTSEILPLELPTSNLKTENTLRFEASSPSFKFLSVNRYDLKDIKLIKEEMSENVREERAFSLSKDKIKKAKLSYFINCLQDTDNQGLLRIFLNEFNVHSAQVVCDAAHQNIEVLKDYFEDKNTLAFEKNFGDFVLEQVKLEVELERKSPTYFFDVNEEDLDKEFTLRLHLVPNEDDERSSATILVNSNSVTLDTERNVFSKDISAFIKEDENFVKIVPKNEFEVISLEVFAE